MNITIYMYMWSVCEIGSRFKQPRLARVRLIRLWGWVRLYTCGPLGNQGIQDKPAINQSHSRELWYDSIYHLLWL